DDRTAAGLRHLCRGELGAEKDAGLVDCDDSVPAFEPVRVADRAAGNPGIVDQDVEPAVGRDCLADQCHPFGIACHVDLRCGCSAAGGTDLAGHPLRVSFEYVGHDNPGALLRKEARFGFAHAVTGAGHDRHLVLQPHDPLPPKSSFRPERSEEPESRGTEPAFALDARFRGHDDVYRRALRHPTVSRSIEETVAASWPGMTAPRPGRAARYSSGTKCRVSFQ